MTKDEALKLALETLEWAVEQAGGPLCEHESGGACCFCKENNAITAIKEALAQPMQEPVAHCYVQKGTSVDILTFDDAPDDAVDGTIFPLYTTPPKREWVELTDEQRRVCVDTPFVADQWANIEAKLKELNHG